MLKYKTIVLVTIYIVIKKFKFLIFLYKLVKIIINIINKFIIFASTYVKLYKRVYFNDNNGLFYNFIAIIKAENAILAYKYMLKACRGRLKGFKNKLKNNF